MDNSVSTFSTRKDTTLEPKFEQIGTNFNTKKKDDLPIIPDDILISYNGRFACQDAI